ncbi:MAG: aminotransferase class III-fold pyridoxal phosphate-dependent enzyme [Geminicoccaceae bacterium]
MTQMPNTLENHWMPFSGNRDFKASPRLVVKSGGTRLYDHQGGEIIDGSSGLFCCPAGHNRPEIAKAVHDQLMTNAYTPHFQLGHPGSFELASRVSRLLPEAFNHVFFVNSGSEAIDTALKVCMAYHRARGEGQRVRFVSRERAYHGVNIGGTSLSGMVKNRETFSGVMPNVVHMRHTWMPEQRFTRGQPGTGAEAAEDLQRFVDMFGASTIAAVFVEPVAGSTGTLVPPVGYLERLREICDQYGLLLVFDEVITGFGRLGAAFGVNAFGVEPDIMTMAKAITNGAQPMGAVAVRDEIYQTVTTAAPENAIEFFHGYTYSAHPAACAAGLATMDIYEREDLFARAAGLVDHFLDAIFSLKDVPGIYDLRGYGLMAGVEVEHDGVPGRRGQRLQKELFWRGLHVKFTGDTGIFAPQFIATRDDIDAMVRIFRELMLDDSRKAA